MSLFTGKGDGSLAAPLNFGYCRLGGQLSVADLNRDRAFDLAAFIPGFADEIIRRCVDELARDRFAALSNVAAVKAGKRSRKSVHRRRAFTSAEG